MKRTDWSYQNCVRILSQELVPATGCTEPIAIAYAAALARDTLGCIPEQIKISCSGNIIKNVKSVIVPGTGNLRGIPAAAGAGIIAGSAEDVPTPCPSARRSSPCSVRWVTAASHVICSIESR